MEKAPNNYKGILYLLIGSFFLFLVVRVFGKSAPTTSVGDISSLPNWEIALFIAGIAIPALLFFIFNSRSILAQDQKESASFNEYTALVNRVQNALSVIRRNNRFYLGTLVVSYGADKFGDILNQPLLSHLLVKSFVYALGFFACIQQMMKGKKIEDQIKTLSMQGLSLEKRVHGNSYFHKMGREPQGFEIFILIFFRILIPSWLVYCAVDSALGSIKGISASVSMTVTISLSLLSAFFLWLFSCRPSFYLLKKIQKESL